MGISLKHIAAAGALAGTLAGGILIGQATADQPHMQNALDALTRAKTELITAIPDKGGHRLRAINLVNQAIMETRASIQYAH